MKKKIIAIIQARSGSSRLKNKMLLNLNGTKLVEWVFSRIKKSLYIDEYVLATTQKKEDVKIIKIAKRFGFKTFRGNNQKVLQRFYLAASKYEADIIVRICADCPFISSSEVDLLINTFINNNRKFSFNHRSFQKFKYADGFGAEIIAFEDLEAIYKKAFLKKHKEHITLYLWENYKNYEITPAKTEIPKNKRYLRADIDNEKDLIVLNDFVKKFSINIDTKTKDIVNYLHKYKVSKDIIINTV